MKQVAILGSTGSIGSQALEIVGMYSGRLSVRALACGKNVGLLRKQIAAFSPEIVCVEAESDAMELAKDFPAIDVVWGKTGLVDVAMAGGYDIVLNSLVGIAGLAPTMAAIEWAAKNSKPFDLALANKEALVTGGALVMDMARKAGVRILPVDSEHSAIFQCIQGNQDNEVKAVYLTASGGPFRGFSPERLKAVTKLQALSHPTWKMGDKITIDSATMMNKGFEIIEAKWLFGLEDDQIKVVIHPESIIHSMVEYEDGAILAQLGVPSMKVPISYAFSFPERWPTGEKTVDFPGTGQLRFGEPEGEADRCIRLARSAIREWAGTGNDSPAIALNGANEVLVQAFLQGRIGFGGICDLLECVMEGHKPRRASGLEEIFDIDGEARAGAEALILAVN